ncbi:MAG: hypothetical protein HOJ23_01370, partial [Gammaproteobacteria bacterium]|nr:hypothetical protein [Gammaproteobacteria bacterium]
MLQQGTGNSTAIEVTTEQQEILLESSDQLLNSEYSRNGGDLIITAADGVTQTILSGYFLNPQPLTSPSGAILFPETVTQLLVNNEPVEVAGPAGSLRIP